MSSLHWRPLTPSTAGPARPPPFLIASSFTATSYSIYFTDLTHIWSESLDRKRIIERSRKEDTSIDPSDNEEQLEIFLGKIKLGIDGGKDSTLSLAVTERRGRERIDDKPPSLSLLINVKLPAPLKSLLWHVDLSPDPRAKFTSKVTIPLLGAQQARLKQIEDLLQRLKEKDHVIQKLLDSIEARGGDLGLLFPHAMGKGEKRISRKKLEERVKGLGPFDSSTWNKSLAGNRDLNVSTLLEEVFTSENSGLVDMPVMQNHSEESQEWWESVGRDSVSLSNNPTKETETNLGIKPPLQSSDSGSKDDDAFQVQATPPRLKHSPVNEAKLPSRTVVEDSTDDEDDDGLDAGTQHSEIPDSFPQSPVRKSTTPPRGAKTKGGRLGQISSRKAEASNKKLPSPSPQPPTIEDDGTTEDDEEENVQQSSIPLKQSVRTKEQTPPKKAQTPPKQKRTTLGRIGTKKRDPSPGSESAQQQTAPGSETEGGPEDTPVKKPKMPTPKKTKLGAIGHKRAAEAASGSDEKKRGGNIARESDTVIEDDSRGRERMSSKEKMTPEVKDPTPQRETSEERADRKREQLKKELEQKAKAPVKKKRKF